MRFEPMIRDSRASHKADLTVHDDDLPVRAVVVSVPGVPVSRQPPSLRDLPYSWRRELVARAFAVVACCATFFGLLMLVLFCSPLVCDAQP